MVGSPDTRVRRGAAWSVLAPVVLGFALSPFMSASSANSSVKAYGARVPFKEGRPLKFPDFSLEYVGQRRVASTRFPRGFLYRDFIVSAGSERITVSWTAGTGDIGPMPFTIAGKSFNLELAQSDSLGRLKPNELVITIKRAAA